MKKLLTILFICLFIFSCDKNKIQLIDVEYFENGSIKTVGWFYIKNNEKIKHGPWIEYYEKGLLNKKIEIDYSYGKESVIISYYENGNRQTSTSKSLWDGEVSTGCEYYDNVYNEIKKYYNDFETEILFNDRGQIIEKKQRKKIKKYYEDESVKSISYYNENGDFNIIKYEEGEQLEEKFNKCHCPDMSD